ncbi:MAG: orotate phosphoribosyltransferase [Bacilli bacterium]|nr:orotate phosphoribosyltransferase [Bacilli bacterium]
MTREELAKQIYACAYLTGEFELRSGGISHEYFDKYMFESNPKLLLEIANHMQYLIPENTKIIAGLEMGGIPIVTALSLKTNIPAAFVRKKQKKYGTCRLAEGTDITEEKVLVIEDIITSGGQVIDSVRELRKQGAIIDTVLCVILRDQKAIKVLVDEGLFLKPLFTMDFVKQQSNNLIKRLI